MGTKRCPKCGYVARGGGSMYCDICGTRLEEAEKPTEAPKEAKGEKLLSEWSAYSSTYKIVTRIISIIPAAVAIIMLFASKKTSLVMYGVEIGLALASFTLRAILEGIVSYILCANYMERAGIDHREYIREQYPLTYTKTPEYSMRDWSVVAGAVAITEKPSVKKIHFILLVIMVATIIFESLLPSMTWSSTNKAFSQFIPFIVGAVVYLVLYGVYGIVMINGPKGKMNKKIIEQIKSQN